MTRKPREEQVVDCALLEGDIREGFDYELGIVADC